MFLDRLYIEAICIFIIKGYPHNCWILCSNGQGANDDTAMSLLEYVVYNFAHGWAYCPCEPNSSVNSHPQ